MEGFFAMDFKLQELKSLTATQPLPFRDHSLDQAGYQIITIEEAFGFWNSFRTDKQGPGLYIELKHPAFHIAQGFNLAAMLLDAIKVSGISPAVANRGLVVQCFDLDALDDFSRSMTALGFDIPLVWLVDTMLPLPSLDALKRLRRLAMHTGIGPDKNVLLGVKPAAECAMPLDSPCNCTAAIPSKSCGGRLAVPQKEWISLVQELGISVHAWTLRNEVGCFNMMCCAKA